MGKRNLKNIILIGFSYTGKSEIGKGVANCLNWNFVDTDDEIVKIAGKTIPEIFSQDGEDKFRELERKILTEACYKEQTVISTGGGAVLSEKNRELIQSSGVVVCLEAKPETIYYRLKKDAEESSESVIRPLLAGPDPKSRIATLKEFRQSYYAVADWTVHTDNLTLGEVCEEVIRGWKYGNRRVEMVQDFEPLQFSQPEARESDAPYCFGKNATFVVTTDTKSYPIFIDWGILDELGKKMSEIGLSGTAYVVSDSHVFPLYGERVIKSLRESNFTVEHFVVPEGEKSKSLEMASSIYDFLVEHRAERGHIVVALGGGVVGDLAGFAAATFLRGLPLIQVPTTLVAMVDSSIGGKTAINHPLGKNLIGSFYQPHLVLADVQTLKTLAKRELTSGWAEAIKHALILDAELFEFFENNASKLLEFDSEKMLEVIKRSSSIKARVVSEDEKEKGLRTVLNYGHTIGHGIEAATNYERFLHGEAVAIGMTGAAMISREIGLLSEEAVKRQKDLLQKFDLPTTCSGIEPETILRAMELDKKVRSKKMRWVLLEEIGKTVIQDDVAGEVVLNVLDASSSTTTELGS